MEKFAVQKRITPIIKTYTYGGVPDQWHSIKNGAGETASNTTSYTARISKDQFQIFLGNGGTIYSPTLVYGHWVCDVRL